MRSLARVVSLVAAGMVATAVSAQPGTPVLVRPDGAYPTAPLAKDVIVVKVVQNTPLNLQKAATIRGLDLPPGELPKTVKDMKDLLDRNSRWLNPPKK